MRRNGRAEYWCVQFTDPITGLITEAGNAISYTAIVIWTQEHLDELPRGEGKFVKKLARRISY